MIVSHDTVDGGGAGADGAPVPVSAARAKATMCNPIRMRLIAVYISKSPGVPDSAAFSAGGGIYLR
jgi:hypothetical protein